MFKSLNIDFYPNKFFFYFVLIYSHDLFITPLVQQYAAIY